MLRVQESNLLFPLCGEKSDSLTRIPDCGLDCHLPPPVHYVVPCRWNVSICANRGLRLPHREMEKSHFDNYVLK